MSSLTVNKIFKENYRKFTKTQGISALLPLIIVVLFFSLMSDNFLSSYNVMNILRQASIYAIMAVGMTFVILTGGIDLGQGSVLALSAVICAMVINITGNMWMGILASISVGVIFGLINGVMIAYVGLPAFIMTLGSLYMVRGLTLYITNSTQVNVKSVESFKFLGQGFSWGIPFPVYIFLFIGIIAVLMLKYTSTGRHIYAVGSNVLSARLSGVKVEKTLVISYIVSSLCVALAGIVYLSRLTSAQPTAGEGYELESIAAVVVGGTSQAGGEGSVLGTLIGAVIIAVIRNGLVLIGVGSYFTKIVVGLIIVLAVTLDVVRRKIAASK